jgi:hypothetical protein
MVSGDGGNCGLTPPNTANGLYDTVYASTQNSSVTLDGATYNGMHASNLELPGGYDGTGYCTLTTGSSSQMATLQGLFSTP